CSPPRVLADRRDGRARGARRRPARAPAHPLDAPLARRTRVHGTVREHDLLPAANVRTATHVVGAGGIDLLLRAAVRRAHLLAGARGAALTGAVGGRCADPARHAGGGAALAAGAGAKRGDTGRLRSRPDRKSTRLNSSHQIISYAVFC